MQAFSDHLFAYSLSLSFSLSLSLHHNRTIARVVSQVHAFQEFPYPYVADPELQAYLRVRIARLGSCDVPLLASDNEANFHQLPSSERHSRRIQETLRRVRATFQ